MLNRRIVFLLTLMVWPVAVSAQPLFHHEHDWTVSIAGQTYGLREVVQTPGEFRRTQIWVCGRSRELKLRAVEVLVIVLAPLAAVVGFGLWRVNRRMTNDEAGLGRMRT